MLILKRIFIKTGSGKDFTEQSILAAVSQLDNLLRLNGVKSVLCNRHYNINFDNILSNSEITFVCTRRGDLGVNSHKAFGLFFLNAMENAVLRRPGLESSRVPHFLYIDEFPEFIGKSTEPIFTMFRKYRVGSIISAQNLSQLNPATAKENYRDTILANCVNKIFTGNATEDDLNWWEFEFGEHREWRFKNTIDFSTNKYDNKHSDVDWKWIKNFLAGKLQYFGQTDCAFKIRNDAGKPLVGMGKMSYLDSKYKEPQKIKKYDFGKYSDGVTTTTEDTENGMQKNKFNPNKIDFLDERNEFNPIQTDTTDSNYLFDNEDAIVVNLKKKPTE